MIREVKKLHGSVLRATDGELGSVNELLFDDQFWTVRYLIVNTGGWLDGRKVLIAPTALGALDWEQRVLNVNLTRSQVENSPGVNTDEPVSRQWEADTYNYYSWPYYWGMGGGPWYSSGLIGSVEAATVPAPSDVHLRSTQEVTGYAVAAQDDDIGHVTDFLVDDETWRIRCLAVGTRDWWPGKQVLLPLDWVGEISWLDQTVTAEVTQYQIRNAPSWEPDKPFSPAFLGQLARYHARQEFGMQESQAGRVDAFAGQSR